MSDISTNALNCEAKKHAYRQTQDGVVVSFVLHPQEVPDGLATAALGTRYMLAMVEIGDDEQPKVIKPAVKEETPAQRKSWQAMSPAQQAGILCNEPKFQKFLDEQEGFSVRDVLAAADWVRMWCGVESRRDIRPGSESGDRWHELVEKYRAWDLAPGVGA